MFMKIFLPSLLSVMMLNVLGCHKTDVIDPNIPTKTDLVSASAWKLDAVGLDQDKNGTIDVSLMSLVSSCQADNTILFKKDNTGITDEGASKCNTTDPQTTSLNWSFADAEANINVSNSILTPLNGKSKILDLNALSLALSRDTTIPGLGNAALVVKLKH
jgi:hypothetical protein